MGKKLLIAFLLFTIFLSASGFVFASEQKVSQVPFVVEDKDYPGFGIHVHSWVDGKGSKTIAHSRVIDLATGKIISEQNTQCQYSDEPDITYGD